MTKPQIDTKTVFEFEGDCFTVILLGDPDSCYHDYYFFWQDANTPEKGSELESKICYYIQECELAFTVRFRIDPDDTRLNINELMVNENSFRMLESAIDYCKQLWNDANK